MTENEPTIHQPCYIGDHAQIGKGTKIGAFCDIGKLVVIGKNCNIQCHVSISNECKIGNNVFIGPGARLLNDKYMNGKITPVIVEDDVRIGGGAIILPGIYIRSRAKIGAGSVVTKHVPWGAVVYGNPAQVHTPRLMMK